MRNQGLFGMLLPGLGRRFRLLPDILEAAVLGGELLVVIFYFVRTPVFSDYLLLSRDGGPAVILAGKQRSIRAYILICCVVETLSKLFLIGKHKF